MNPKWRYCLAVTISVWIIWIALMTEAAHWHLFFDNWFMTVTMCFGSFIAGATSEGGGAVAFPVMTLLFHIPPAIARDFSLLIQSVGMTAASLLIVLFKIRVEWRAVWCAGLGGAVGIIVGLHWIAPLLPADYTKMFFTSLWLSFGVALYWVNCRRDRIVFKSIVKFKPWHGGCLAAVGLLGGLISGVTGSGLDIMTFTLLTMVFGVSEKVATPTSVVLMASNAVVGTAWSLGFGRIAPEAVDYWYVCVPVVVVGAPLGAFFISQQTRLFVSHLLCTSILLQFVMALLIVPLDSRLLAFTITTLGCGAVVFLTMAKVGRLRCSK